MLTYTCCSKFVDVPKDISKKRVCSSETWWPRHSPIFFQCSDRTVDTLMSHNRCSKRRLPQREGCRSRYLDGRGKTTHVSRVASIETDANANGARILDMPYVNLNKDHVHTDAITCITASHRRRASIGHNMFNVTRNAHVDSMNAHNDLCTCCSRCLHKLRNNTWKQYWQWACILKH